MSYCSNCNCGINRDLIQTILNKYFIDHISNNILDILGSVNYKHIIHLTSDNIPHVVCKKCEDIINQRLCFMDTNIFKCPHYKCLRMIYA